MGTSQQVDVVVLGMGPGGEEVAGRLASSGMKVVGIEGRLVGGECPYWGCVPSKAMVWAADLLGQARRIPGVAGEVSVDPQWAEVARRVREVTDSWDDRVAVERFESKGGRLVRGWGRLDGPGRVAVGDESFVATRAVVVATGAKAWAPPIPGLSEAGYWTNREAIEATEIPSSLVILGGGAIGVELGQVYSRFGTEVTIVEASDRLVAAEEPEAGDLLGRVLSSEGLTILTGVRITEVSRTEGLFNVHTDSRVISGEKLLVATGRRCDLAAIGVGSIGLDETARAVTVDGNLRAAPGVWAVGDITGVGAFTHVAMYQANIAVADILGNDHLPADYRGLPRVTFTDPEIGSVGLSEASARDRGFDVRIGHLDLSSSTRGWINQSEGFVKLVEDARRKVLVGATFVGPAGGEVLGLLTLAVHAEVPLDQLRSMIYAYPTFHRAIDGALSSME